jgi:hypothetical protein
VVVGDTVEEPRAKRGNLDSLVHGDSAIGLLSIGLGVDAPRSDPDGPLGDIPETNASKSGRERAVALAHRKNVTVRQLGQRPGGYVELAFVGTPPFGRPMTLGYPRTGGDTGLHCLIYRGRRGAEVQISRMIWAKDAERMPDSAGSPLLARSAAKRVPVAGWSHTQAVQERAP